MCTYLTATESINKKKSKGEVLVFRHGYTPASLEEKGHDEETADYDKSDSKPAKSAVDATDITQKQETCSL
jgi:hypothetical protein